MKKTELQQQGDEYLMGELAKGNRQALEVLYDRYFDKLVWFASTFTGDLHAAEDIVQEVFMKVIECPDLFNPEKKFSTWIYTITGNKCRNLLRDTGNRDTLLRQQLFELSADPQNRYDQQKLTLHLNRLIHEMNDKDKSLFTLRFEHQMKIREIAELTSIPEGSVKSGIFSLLKKLSKHLKPFTDHE